MPREVKVSLHFLHIAWQDTSRPVREIAHDFGMCARTLQRIVKLQGWPARNSGNRRAILTPAKVKPLWDAGLRCCDIATILRSSTKAVQTFAVRQGWHRYKGWRPAITLDQWAEEQLAQRMAEAVQRGRAA